tara:strand:+ start:196 stop:495 length:300 start_codon:yes stop_codon:yes gene_type:complete
MQRHSHVFLSKPRKVPSRHSEGDVVHLSQRLPDQPPPHLHAHETSSNVPWLLTHVERTFLDALQRPLLQYGDDEDEEDEEDEEDDEEEVKSPLPNVASV